ncbi:unnamed protein product [Candidula unifasciata]|uniref:FYVE-type domain-containing protein n=1 Tax=Candidula unifasciata TaxID=100452 RepID=A0A8S3ZHA1_9EUPU|nr:unnamed protein product [Candidula unifasciata]
MDYIRVEGSLILPAKVDGSPDVFQRPYFTLVKPEWVPDEQCSYCELCSVKFTQVKRRHHCRMCGAVRCAQCCSQKIPLPQLGLEEAERVCHACKTVAELVTKARSSNESTILEAAKGLSTFAKHEKHIKKLLELGGTQTLVVLASVDNINVLGHVTSGLHALVTHPSLHKHLAESGVIKAICKILSHVGDTQEQIAIDGISSLMIFCKYQSLKTKVLIDGGLQPVLSLCWSNKTAISLLSITTLGLIAELPATHTTIYDNRQNAVSRLLQLANAPDEQLQEVALKTLAYLSTGLDEYRHRLVQEDSSTGHCLQTALKSSPINPQILCNAACLTANLATSAQDQNELQELLWTVCQKLPQADANTELLCHLTRALANFSQHKQNTNILINTIPDVVKYCLKSPDSSVQLQGMRLLINLLTHAPARVSSLIVRKGSSSVFPALVRIKVNLILVQSKGIRGLSSQPHQVWKQLGSVINR